MERKKTKHNRQDLNMESIKAIDADDNEVTLRKKEEPNPSVNTVEDLINRLVPLKSFLHTHQASKSEKLSASYIPMKGKQKTEKRFSRLSLGHFDLKNFRFSKNENFHDRGYYDVKTNDKCQSKEENKHKSLSTVDDMYSNIEENLYEDLYYNDVTKQYDDAKIKTKAPVKSNSLVVIRDLCHSFKTAFTRKHEENINKGPSQEVKERNKNDRVEVAEERSSGNIYENNEMYYSVPIKREMTEVDLLSKQSTLPLEEYLEPVQLRAEYCDVLDRGDDVVVGCFDALLRAWGIKESNDSIHCEDTSDQKENEIEEKSERKKKTNMAERPLPVPIENEPYYMNIDRNEAENLLKGQPDGTFLLRPSSQSNHAYTLTVSCSNQVHNVGIRRRPDGLLALGYARRGEKTFHNVSSLVERHRKHRLLLVSGGAVRGATTLNDSPQYYQTPNNVPLKK